MIERSVDGPVATLALSRPSARNALSPALLSSMIEACTALRDDPRVHVVVVRGVGGAFSAGADLLAFAPALASDGALEVADLGRRALDAVAELPQITVAFVDGPCVGGGLVLACACDLRLATPGARFWLPELEAGIPVAWGAMAPLRRVLGEARLVDLVLTGRRFGADEALAWGLVSEVVDAPDARVARLAAVPGSTLRVTRRQLQGLRAGTFDRSSDAEALLAAVRDPEVVAAMQRYLMSRQRA